MSSANGGLAKGGHEFDAIAQSSCVKCANDMAQHIQFSSLLEPGSSYNMSDELPGIGIILNTSVHVTY